MDTTRIGYGALAGLAGGLLFGAMMHMMGMIGMIGALIGMEGAAAGWVVQATGLVFYGLVHHLGAEPPHGR